MNIIYNIPNSVRRKAVMPSVIITLFFFNCFSNNRELIRPTIIQIAKLRKNIGQVLVGGQSPPIGGIGYSKILKGKPPVAMISVTA